MTAIIESRHTWQSDNRENGENNDGTRRVRAQGHTHTAHTSILSC
jgi:hypothetical protein